MRADEERVKSGARSSHREPKARRAALLCMVLLLAAPGVGLAEAAPVPAWWEGAFTLSTGFSYSTGEYGEPVDTDLIYVPVTFAYVIEQFALTDYPWDQLELRVTVPFLAIDGPADFFSGSEANETRSDSGLGDVLVRGSYIWLPATGSPWPVAELKAQVKVPTADESKNLGTGSTDGQLEAALSKRFGIVSPYISVGYRFAGNAAELGLNSFAFATLGASVRVHPRLLLGMDYAFAQASADSRDHSHELIPFASVRLSAGVRFAPYASFGLAGYVPDFGGGFSISYTLPVRSSERAR
jgi:hypothetical protein